MCLDDGPRTLDRDGLDHVGIERALHEELDVRNALRFFFEDGDELVADALALHLRLFDAGESFVEALARVDGDDVHAESFGQTRDHLDRLVFSQHAVVDEDRGELIADRFGDEQRGDRRIDAAADGSDYVTIADLLANLFDLASAVIAEVPRRLTLRNVEQEVLQDLRTRLGVRNLGMKLDAVARALAILERGDRRVG